MKNNNTWIRRYSPFGNKLQILDGNNRPICTMNESFKYTADKETYTTDYEEMLDRSVVIQHAPILLDMLKSMVYAYDNNMLEHFNIDGAKKLINGLSQFKDEKETL